MGVIEIKTLEINSQQFLVDDDIEKGFLKGSIWKNLFSPYKFVVEKINLTTDLDKLLYMLQVYTFTAIELTLYIDTHPNNKEASDMLKKVNAEKNKICEYIETRYSSLSSFSEILNGYYSLKMPWSDK